MGAITCDEANTQAVMSGLRIAPKATKRPLGPTKERTASLIGSLLETCFLQIFWYCTFLRLTVRRY